MNVALYIAKRYLISKSSNNAINIMTVISAIGIVIAAAALFIVLSGFSGLKNFSLEFSSYVDPDLKVVPIEGKAFLINDEQLKKIESIYGIESFSKVIEEKAIIEVENKRKIVTLKGVDGRFADVTNIDSMLVSGNWIESESPQLVSGRGVAHSLSFGILDFTKSIVVYVPKPGKGQITSVRGAFRTINAINTGVFAINEELDNNVIYTDISVSRYLLDYEDNKVSAIELKLHPEANEKDITNSIELLFDNSVQVKNRAALNDALYKMLNTENMAVYLIFTLVIIIALFNVIGALIMMILDKKASLNTLYNLGVTAKDIRRIFFIQGSLMSVLGGGLGLLIGLLIVYLQLRFNLVMITPSLPYPVNITLLNFLIVLGTIIVLGIFASKIASTRINKKLVRT